MQYRGTKVIIRDGLTVTARVKQDIYKAWLKLQNLHRTHPGAQYKAKLAGHGGWKISSLNGVDVINILGYPEGEEEEKKKKPKFKDTLFFVPGICLIPNDDTRKIEYYWGKPSSYYISICFSADWTGRICVLPESPIVCSPGQKWPDNPVFEVLGLTEFGTSRTSYHRLKKKTTSVAYHERTDTGFNPMPYNPYGPAWPIAEGAGALHGNVSNSCAERTEIEESLNRAPFQTGGDMGGHFADGYCDEYDDTGNCCNNKYLDSQLMLGWRSSDEWLWDDIKVVAVQCHMTYDKWYYMGFCFGMPITSEAIETVLHDGTIGGPQNRVATEYTADSYDLYIESVDDTLKNVGYKKDHIVRTLTLTAPSFYAREQHGVRTTSTATPAQVGIAGAYVDTNEDTPSVLKNKYFVLYTLEVSKFIVNAVDDDWTVRDAAGYRGDKVDYEDGVWKEGIPSYMPVSNDVTVTNRVELWAYLQGQYVLLDSEPYVYAGYSSILSYPKFRVTDAHILTALGSIYYMYAYQKIKVDVANQYKNIITKVQYGYFKDTAKNHVQSKAFVPEGFTHPNRSKYTTPHHDVYGSKNFETPLYGIGKCAGFLVNRTVEMI